MNMDETDPKFNSQAPVTPGASMFDDGHKKKNSKEEADARNTEAWINWFTTTGQINNSKPETRIPTWMDTDQGWNELIRLASRTTCSSKDSLGGGHAVWKNVKAKLSELLQWMGRNEEIGLEHGYVHWGAAFVVSESLPSRLLPTQHELAFIKLALGPKVNKLLERALDATELKYMLADSHEVAHRETPFFWQGYSAESEKALRDGLERRIAAEQLQSMGRVSMGEELKGAFKAMKAHVDALDRDVKDLLGSPDR